jgi:hypothetical protein
MTHVLNRLPLPDSRVNDLIIDVLSTSILVLAGIISVVQFAYY